MRNSLIFTTLLIGIVFVSDLDAQRRSKRSSKRMQDVQNEEVKEASADLSKQYGFSSRKEMVEHLLSQNLSRSERRIVEKFSDGQKLNGREQKRLEQFLQKYPQGEQGAVSNRSGRSSRSGRGERSARSSRSGRKTRDTSKRTTRQGRQQVQADDAPVVSGLDFGFSGSVERPPEDDASSGLQSGRRSGRSATDLVPTADDSYDLGTGSLQWRNIYTGDLHLSNMTKDIGNIVDGSKGDWTIQEGSDDLFLINNNSGKKYKFNLTEV